MKVKTEEAILKKLIGVSAEDLFDMRLDFGMKHAIKQHGLALGATMYRRKKYWTVFLRFWEHCDQRFLSEAEERGLHGLRFNVYERFMIKHVHKRQLSRQLVNEIKKDTEGDLTVAVPA